MQYTINMNTQTPIKILHIYVLASNQFPECQSYNLHNITSKHEYKTHETIIFTERTFCVHEFESNFDLPNLI